MANIATFPLPTNNSAKPMIVAGKAGQLTALPLFVTGDPVPSVDGPASPTIADSFPIVASPTVTEGNWAYAVFNFQTSSTNATRVLLKDTVSITYAFDGIAAEDWVPGTFKIATLNANGTIQQNNGADYYLSGTGVTVTAPSIADGWFAVNNTTNTASSGTIEYRDITPFDPATGTGAYGVVLAVQLAKDNVTETNNGEHVKFKVTQNSASGTAFTQSNYTEAKNIVVSDFISAVDFLSPAGNSTFTFAPSGSEALSVGTTTAVAGNKDVFAFGNATTEGKSDWNTDNTKFVNIKSFGTDDVLNVFFSGTTAPGLSLHNFGDLSAQGITNEAYLMTGLRALNGMEMNAGGIYMMQVKDADTGSLTTALTTSSTYILVDTNRNGTVDTNAAGGDLLIRLEAVGVNTLQSTNFLLSV